MKDVENFLKRFHMSENVNEVFTRDCRYWFAAILFGRFIRDGATIMYDETTNHFGTKVRDRVYDITGDVTDKYNWIIWDSYTNKENRERIVNELIMN